MRHHRGFGGTTEVAAAEDEGGKLASEGNNIGVTEAREDDGLATVLVLGVSVDTTVRVGITVGTVVRLGPHFQPREDLFGSNTHRCNSHPVTGALR